MYKYDTKLDNPTGHYFPLISLSSANKEIETKKVLLHNSWFILPNGILYNAGNGHKSTSIKDDFYYIKSKRNTLQLSQYYFNMAKRIEKEGFNLYDYMFLLDEVYFPIYLNIKKEVSVFHEEHILTTLLGIVYAKAYFYKYFENLNNESSDYNLDLNKIKEVTNNEMSDIFVRYCGFHKIESKLNKTITTSCINYEEEFKEYIKRGWNINFISPIVINKNKKI